jgi:DNA repair exonuclease SbcCD ATPase subunit
MSTQTTTTSHLTGLHERLTVLPAAPAERATVLDDLARALARVGVHARGGALPTVGADDFDEASREAALRRVEEHERIRGELAAKLRRTRELQAVTANRRDEAAARARRMSAHLDDCDSLLERAGELTNAAEEARRDLEARRSDVETARGRLVLVDEQREAAAQMIDDAARQLGDLETSELDETTLRRELEAARAVLAETERIHAEANDHLRGIEQAMASRAGIRDHVLHERAELVSRVEAPLPDSRTVRDSLAAFDGDTRVGEPDLVARELAREWIEVDGELERIEAALPVPPSPDELAAAGRRLDQIEQTIAELEAAGRGPGLDPAARDEIEAAHEAVLEAEEAVDQSDGHDADMARLNEAREIEHAVLRRHGFDTYLDMIFAGPRPDGDAQEELLDTLRARRVAEDTLASLRAASDPPAIVTTLRTRRDRIYREAADMLGCDPGANVAELLYAHPVVPPNRTRALAETLTQHRIRPIGVAVREAAVSWLVELDQEVAGRQALRDEIDRLDRDMAALDDEDVQARVDLQAAHDRVSRTHADVGATLHRVRLFEDELSQRTTHDERREERLAAARQLRSQIAAVTEALERTEQEYASSLAAAEAAVAEAEDEVERATAALSDAVRRLKRISEALPPALRPRSGDDPLGELPRLRETLAAEVDRAESALSSATDDLDRTRAEIDDTQAQLDDHLAVVPTEDVGDDDRLRAVHEVVGAGDEPVVLVDPYTTCDDRIPLLDRLADEAGERPVVLLTDDAEVLGWAISLPDDMGAVTRVAAVTEHHPLGGDPDDHLTDRRAGGNGTPLPDDLPTRPDPVT